MRWAAFAAAFIASATGWSHAQEPAAKPQPRELGPTAAEQGPAVILEADQVTSENNQIIAEGNVEARYQNRTLRADRLIYDTEKHTVHAQGRIQVIDDDGAVRFADEIEVDDQLNAGVATGFSTRLPGGGTAAAASAVLLPDGEKELNRVVYTACPVCKDGRTPTWTLRARKAVQNPNTKMISYRDVALDIHGVPVLWLPFFSHPDPTAGRKSGFLLPDIGQNSRLGAFYAQPYYWAISDYSDLTIAPKVMANVNPLLLLKYRKRFWSGDLEIEASGAYDNNFDNAGNHFGNQTFNSHIFANGRFNISDYWSWNFGIARVSDDLYLKRYDIPTSDNRQAGVYLSDWTRLVSHVDLNGQNENSYANLSLMSVQGLRAEDTEANLPLVLPMGEYDRTWRDPWLDGQLKLKLSTANLMRTDSGVDSSRLSATGEWEVEKIFGPGLVISPFLQGRQDIYRVENYTSTDPVYVPRTLALGGAELRWPLVHASANASYMIEPIAMLAVGSSGGNDARIPNEDSLSFELDDTSLFRPNGAPNYDLWEPGPRASLGVRASAASTLGTATAEFGRRWRSEAAPQFSDLTNLAGTTSDWVGSLSADLGSHFGGDLRLRLDDATFKINRLDTSIHTRIGPFSGVVRYFDLDKSLAPTNPSQEIAGSIGYDINRHWNVTYGLRRDLDSAINLSQNAGVIYKDDCTFVEFVYTHTETADRTIGPSEGFQIRVGLSTLGVFGGG